MSDRLVMFDFDGTLVDGAAQISECMTFAFQAAGLTPPSTDAVVAVIGLSLPEMVSVLLGAELADRFDKVVASYRFYFTAAIAGEIEPPVYDGAEAALDRLHGAGVVLAITTGKSAKGLDHSLDALAWRHYFTAIQCADDNPSKPDPTMVNKVLAETGVPPERAMLVGDTSYDMRMARAAGVRAIGVEWGYHPVLRLYDAGAETVVQDFEALTDLIMGQRTCA